MLTTYITTNVRFQNYFFFKKGGQAKLSEKQLSELKNKASKGSFAIANDVQHYIKQNFGVEHNLSNVQLLCKKNSIIL